MHQAEQVRLLKELMAHLDAGTNVDAGGTRRNPVSVYTDPDMAAREWEEFYQGYPQVVGLSSDLPEPGTFLTTADFGVPVLATRDGDGQFRAFVNVCRHRGVVVEDRAEGSASKFSCPFHAWTYSNTGDLVSIPKEDHFGDVDKSCHGLVPLPAAEAHGFLWVHADPEGSIDLDGLLGGLGDELDSWDFGRLSHAGSDSYDMALNWKLAMDTFGETYHFNTLHRNTLARDFYGNVQCYDTFGRNHRMILCLRAIDELRGAPEDDWHITDGAFPVYYLFPNVQLNVASMGLIMVRVYPDPTTPGRSVSRISFYVDADRIGEGGGEGAATFASIIRDEDYAVAERAQRGAFAATQETVLFGRNEPALHHYHNTYRAALGMEPLELITD